MGFSATHDNPNLLTGLDDRVTPPLQFPKTRRVRLGGDFFVEAKNLSFRGEFIRVLYDEDHPTIDVDKTGRGIKPEQLGRIFDPGFTTKGVGVGTGLGLSITYKIIQRHKGDIRVQSEPGRGSKVTIVLPIEQNRGPGEMEEDDGSGSA